MFGNVKLRGKLVGAFFSVGSLAAIIGVVGLVGLRSMKLAAADLVKSENVTLQALEATYATAQTSMFVAMAIVFIVSILLGLLLSRRIVQPLTVVMARAEKLRSLCITNLGKGAEALAQGDFHFAIETGTTPINSTVRDETGELARTIDGMILQTQGTVAAFERAQDTLRHAMEEASTLTARARAGQLGHRAEAQKYAGGYQELVGGLNSLLDAVTSPIQSASTVLQRIAARDLTARVDGEYQGDFARIKIAINEAATNLDAALADVSMSSAQVASASREISTGSESLARSSGQQASAVEEISSSLQEVASMAQQSAVNAGEARKLAESARADAKRGVESMQQLSTAVGQIKQSSDATAKIVRTIDEIAFQTNLLALNAAVEAARAGDAGRGFAVVAEEVRNLAIRSATAAKDTSNLIDEALASADRGVAFTAEVVERLDAIRGGIRRMSEVMAGIVTASEQQTHGISQIDVAVAQMNSLTQSTAANSEESASAAAELSSQADRMREMVGTFSLTNGSTAVRRQTAAARAAAPRARPAELGRLVGAGV